MELIIRPKDKWWQLDLKELWQFRDLFFVLTWRDVKVKYKQTMVGVLWAIFQPFITMIVFTVFFGRLAKLPSDGIPYPIFVYTGLVFWTLFASSLASVSDSFVTGGNLLTKVYFPRIIMAVSAIFTNVVDFAVATVILVFMMMYYHYAPTITGVLMFPILLIMTVLSTLGIGLLSASLNVKYRDIRYVLPFFIQLLIFITPVIYPVSIVSARHQWILGLNPMAGIIDAARAGLLGSQPVNWPVFFVSLGSMLFFCAIGYLYFKKVERYFADII